MGSPDYSGGFTQHQLEEVIPEGHSDPARPTGLTLNAKKAITVNHIIRTSFVRVKSRTIDPVEFIKQVLLC